jgi:ribosome-dependent ATPase
MNAATVARFGGVRLRYRRRVALDGIDLEIREGELLGLIGPDGVGKSSLLALLAGARRMQEGSLEVLGGDMCSSRHRARVAPRIAFMPQGLGRNLYPTLSVAENLDFVARLYGQGRRERRRRIEDATRAVGLAPFLDRPAAKLSGGMRQKLGLCCALVHDPDLLILDEPTTGVDPLSRRRFWELIAALRAERPRLTVVVATAYIEEAESFDRVVALDRGRILAAAPPAELVARTGTDRLEHAFVALLPEALRSAHAEEHARGAERRTVAASDEIAIEARGLSKRFDGFAAVDRASLSVRRGEIFGFIGSNGCGKTTVMKMLTGLLEASEGEAFLFGRPVDARDLATRRRVGYMSQTFSLYRELTVGQNLAFHARLFGMPEAEARARVRELAERFGLVGSLDALPDALPLGVRQRLSLAVAVAHRPELLILDEPTAGVDPIARDAFWRHMTDLARRDGVTIFFSTHFMGEAERCDRVALMHAGRILATGAPAEVARARGAASLEDAFVAALEEAGEQGAASVAARAATTPAHAPATRREPGFFSIRRAWSFAAREALELRRDAVRAALALVGSLVLMIVVGFGMGFDVEDLPFAVLDRDQTALSRDYALSLSGSRYFTERPPIADHAELDRRMRSGELSLALEIPPDFARAVERGEPVEIGAWADGAMPQRAETVRGYVAGMHGHWLATLAEREGAGAASAASAAEVETRFLYNPDVRSLPALVPAIIPMLLLMVPAMLAALSVVREKELGSIVNFHVSPATRAEFLIGKQLPYLAIGVLNFVLMCALATTGLGVPVKGDFAALLVAATAFVGFATAYGLLFSSFMRSQIAAIFATMIGTMIPVVQYAGLINPASTLEGAAAVISRVFPATHMITVSRGIFGKDLGFGDLPGEYLALAVAAPATLLLAVLLLRKQAR